MIKAEEFLDAIFEDMPGAEHVCVSRQMEKKDGSGVWFKNLKQTDRQWLSLIHISEPTRPY